MPNRFQLDRPLVGGSASSKLRSKNVIIGRAWRTVVVPPPVSGLFPTWISLHHNETSHTYKNDRRPSFTQDRRRCRSGDQPLDAGACLGLRISLSPSPPSPRLSAKKLRISSVAFPTSFAFYTISRAKKPSSMHGHVSCGSNRRSPQIDHLRRPGRQSLPQSRGVVSGTRKARLKWLRPVPRHTLIQVYGFC